MPDQLSAVSLTQVEAYALVDAVMAREHLALTASAHETEDTGQWAFQAVCDSPPDLPAFQELAERVLSHGVVFDVAPLDTETDWVSKSLQGLAPVMAGGFYIHGSHEVAPVPPGLIGIRIDAAQAFGTGHHETTTGCLEAISRLLKRHNVRRPIDIGTGTGVLAMAVAKRRRVRVVASDIDPVATRVAAENARLNGVAQWIVPVCAAGLNHPLIRAGAPYDLILANILAGPLARLAPALGRVVSRGAFVVLSGILRHQAARVLAAYRLQGFGLVDRLTKKDWVTLTLQRR